MPTRKEILEGLVMDHQMVTLKPSKEGFDDLWARFNALLNDDPHDPNVLFSVATLAMQQGHNGLAINLFHRTLAHNRNNPDVWNNMGTAWRGENNIEEARKCFLRALAMNENPKFMNNIGTLYINEGNPKEGIPYLERALQLSPDDAQCKWNLSLMLLELGDWGRGFTLMDEGLITGDRPMRFFSKDIGEVPLWDGSTTTKRVVIYGEQGLGDEILFASAMNDAMRATGGNVIIECHPRLLGLMSRSFPGVKVYPTRKDNLIEWPENDQPELKCAIGSLFRHFRSDGQFPRETFLVPDPVRVAEYREWLKATGPGPYIGIGWHGGSKKTRIDQRNFKLNHLRPLLEQQATWISLQYTEGAKEKCDRFLADTGIRIHHWPEVVQAFDYDETVALIAALDLIIVPNTAAVHVAGAIGAPCWTLTPDKCAWRYTMGGDHMVFYGDHVWQFRQAGDWEATITKVAQELAGFIAERQS